MLTRMFYAVHGLLYAGLVYLGFYYLRMDEALLEEFFKVGWEAYNGPSLRSPENTYYPYWLMASMFSIGMVLTTKREKGNAYSRLERLLLGFSVVCAIIYMILYLLDGGASMKESQFFWMFTGIVQIGLSFLLFYEKTIAKTINLGQKHLYGLNGLFYIALLAVGYYYYQWDLAILEERDAVGWENYQGPDRDDPENAYHLILMLATVFSLILGLFDQANKIKGAMKVYKGFFIFYFLYSGFVYMNDGNPDMEETMYWWVGLAVLATGISFVFYKETENRLPEKEVVYDDNILDDFSSLE